MFMYSADSDNFPGMVKLPHLVAGQMANIYSHMCLILYGMTLVSENPCFKHFVHLLAGSTHTWRPMNHFYSGPVGI